MTALRSKATVVMDASEVGLRAARMLRGARPEDRMSKEDRIQRGRSDLRWFCNYYLPHYFSSEPAEFHLELAELVMTHERGAFAAPREHAKSTTVSFALPIHHICFKLAMFLVIFRESDAVAHINVDDIRQELETNERIREDFGDLVGTRKWSEGQFVTSNGVKVIARGRGGSARGLRHKEHRPDLVIVDDIEDDELVESKLQREKLMRWFKRVVSNLVGPGGKIFVIGTILHHDSLLVNLLKEQEVYVTRLWKAIKENGQPLWPSRWPLTRLLAKKKEVGARAFATEFQNEAGNEEDQIFGANVFRRFKDQDIDGLKLDLVAAIDPAIGQKVKNDDTAIAVIGGHGGNYYILSMRLKKLKITQQVEAIIATARAWPHLQKFGFETIAYQESLKQLVEEACRKDNLQIPCVAVEDLSTDKLKRIGTLAPLAEQGRIYFPSASSTFWSTDVEKCLEQFEALGVSGQSHDDGPDVVERAIKLLRRSASGHKGKVRFA